MLSWGLKLNRVNLFIMGGRGLRGLLIQTFADKGGWEGDGGGGQNARNFADVLYECLLI